jgi:N-methylhydantoinase A/oxoprolinase/acetone carboxylase beta subunit
LFSRCAALAIALEIPLSCGRNLNNAEPGNVLRAVAVDIAGTFTDLGAFNHATGAVVYAKNPTTCDNFVAGILTCLTKAQIAARDITNVSHGTTLVINSLIQRGVAPV